jgi:hypothetical protein
VEAPEQVGVAAVNWAEIGTAVGGLIGTGVVGAVLNGWWNARKATRADAVDSANSKAQISMLEDARKERQEMALQLATERTKNDALKEANTLLKIQVGDMQSRLDSSELRVRLAYGNLAPQQVKQIEEETTAPAPLGPN